MRYEEYLTKNFETILACKICHKVNCPEDWSGNIIFHLSSIFEKLKAKIIIFLKEKGECANYFL